MSDDIKAIAARIEAMSPPEKLRFAAELLETRNPKMVDIALDVAGKVVDELRLVRLLDKHPKASSPFKGRGR